MVTVATGGGVQDYHKPKTALTTWTNTLVLSGTALGVKGAVPEAGRVKFKTVVWGCLWGRTLTSIRVDCKNSPPVRSIANKTTTATNNKKHMQDEQTNKNMTVMETNEQIRKKENMTF